MAEFVYRVLWLSGEAAFEHTSAFPLRLGEVFFLFCDALFDGQTGNVQLHYGDNICNGDTSIRKTVMVEEHEAVITAVRRA